MPTSVAIILIVVSILAALLVFWLVGMTPHIQAERARELFRLQCSLLENQLLAAARSTGSPRGLIWRSCEFQGDAIFAWERETRRITAFVPLLIQFDADPDGDMVGLPAVEQPREATGLFVFQQGRWITSGKVIFNHTPEQTFNRFAAQYRRIDR